MNTAAKSPKVKSALTAMALACQDTDSLPKVLATGKNELATLIIEIAKNAHIPIQENKDLIALLDRQQTGPIVSTKALQVLAEVVAFLYHTDTALTVR